jgi:exosortase
MVDVPGAQTAPDSGLTRTGILVAVLAFAPVLLGLARVWGSVPYYAHGFLVPIFAGAAAYGLRDRLVAAPAQPRIVWAWAAVLGVYLLGLMAGDITLQGLALVAAVTTGVLQTWGLAGVRTLGFPLFFLLFMVPLPRVLVEPFIGWLQLQVSEAATAVLSLVGSSVSREGNVLILPGGEALFVADACSGITSLITLTPLAVALAWYAEKRWSSRFWILASVVPLALVANLLRVVGTTLAAERWGSAAVVASAWHDLSGLATFTLACVGLLGVSNLVRGGHDAAPA